MAVLSVVIRGVIATALIMLSTQTALADIIDDETKQRLREDYARPSLIPFPKEAPYSPQIATLGKMLYFDPRVSGAQNMTCATCHNPSFGWEAPVETAVGAMNEPIGRHAPTILNMAWGERFFLDGRADTLEDQAAGPITAPVEMNMPLDELVDRLEYIDVYKNAFDKLFPGEGLTENTILSAIATYERTVVSGEAPFDRWVEGDDTALSDSAKRGLLLFEGKAGCSNCHNGWNFTDNGFHDIGVYTDDIGRGDIDHDDPLMMYAFKTPSLRNIEQRSPYLHNGETENLEQVIALYADGGDDRPSKSPLIQPFEYSDQELEDLLAFLKSLTGENEDTPTPILPVN